MEFLEKDLETIIWESDKIKLSERGLSLNGKIKRQLKIGNYGILDLLTIEKKYEDEYNNPYLSFTIYELKKDKIGISAFLQALNYCKGIKTYMEEKRSEICFELNIVLIGREIDTSGSFIFIEDLFSKTHFKCKHNSINYIKFYTYKYGIDGLVFKRESNYNLTSYGF